MIMWAFRNVTWASRSSSAYHITTLGLELEMCILKPEGVCRVCFGYCVYIQPTLSSCSDCSVVRIDRACWTSTRWLVSIARHFTPRDRNSDNAALLRCTLAVCSMRMLWSSVWRIPWAHSITNLLSGECPRTVSAYFKYTPRLVSVATPFSLRNQGTTS